MIPFTKPYLTVPDQLALLGARGMVIADLGRATAYLERIGYYRLSGYWRILQDRGSGNAFLPGVQFGHVIDLYVFDKKLRLLMLDAIERIEIALRCDIVLLLGKLSPFAHRDKRYLHPKFTTQVKPRRTMPEHFEWLAKLDKAAKRKGEEITEHFNATYSSHLPLWMSVELWDVGMLSVFLNGMRYQDQEQIARLYQLPRPELLPSWIRSVNLVRNICAHHGRLWNRAIVDQPKPPQPNEIPLLDHLSQDQHAQRRLYAVAASVRYLLRRINPMTTWGARLAELMETFPTIPGVSIHQMGFSQGWQNLSIWP